MNTNDVGSHDPQNSLQYIWGFFFFYFIVVVYFFDCSIVSTGCEF